MMIASCNQSITSYGTLSVFRMSVNLSLSPRHCLDFYRQPGRLMCEMCASVVVVLVLLLCKPATAPSHQALLNFSASSERRFLWCIFVGFSCN